MITELLSARKPTPGRDSQEEGDQGTGASEGRDRVREVEILVSSLPFVPQVPLTPSGSLLLTIPKKHDMHLLYFSRM